MTPWYVESFGREYLDLYPSRDEAEAQRDIAAIQSLIAPPRDAPLLDLGCGAGRHLLALREAGFTDLTGLDLSTDLLEVAARRLEGAGVALIHADMRRIPDGRPFTTILSLFTSFGYFQEDTENRAVLIGLRRALAPGGTVLIDTLNPTYVIDHLVRHEETVRSGRTVRIERFLDSSRERVNKRTAVLEPDGSTKTYEESVRMYSRRDFVEMLRAAGFGAIEVYGSLSGERHERGSERLILVARSDG